MKVMSIRHNIQIELDEGEIVTPVGMVQYDVPIMKVQTYLLDDIFGKGLLMLVMMKATIKEIEIYC